jgi:hypothetical protein
MLKGEDKWKAVRSFSDKVMSKKERAERVRRGEAFFFRWANLPKTPRFITRAPEVAIPITKASRESVEFASGRSTAGQRRLPTKTPPWPSSRRAGEEVPGTVSDSSRHPLPLCAEIYS